MEFAHFNRTAERGVLRRFVFHYGGNELGGGKCARVYVSIREGYPLSWGVWQMGIREMESAVWHTLDDCFCNGFQ